MSEKLRQSALSIGSALATAEQNNMKSLRDCARATATVLDGLMDNAVADQAIVDELVRSFSQIAEGQRIFIHAHSRLAALGRKLGLDPQAWGDCVPYPALASAPAGPRAVEAA
jgi:hypothetical protein